MNTPVPFSFACKQMLFAIFPSSGGKNTIVVSLVVSHSPWFAFLVCCCVVAAWGFIFEKYIRGRYINPSSSSLNSEKQAPTSPQGLIRSRSESDLFRESFPANNPFAENRYPGELEFSRYNKSEPNDIEHLEGVLEFDDEEHHKELSNDAVPLLSTAPVAPLPSALPVNKTSSPSFRMNSVSGMISPSHFSTIISWILPEYQHSLVQLSLMYTLQRDGASLATLLSCCSSNTLSHTSPTDDIFHSTLSTTISNHHSHHQVIILIEDSWGYVFGSYLSHPLKVSADYYGNGENFVFALLPQPAKYDWTGKNEYFILSNYHQIIIGGGNGYSIQLDDELNTGVSNGSDTYMNPTLSSNEFFKCLNVEVWAIESAV